MVNPIIFAAKPVATASLAKTCTALASTAAPLVAKACAEVGTHYMKRKIDSKFDAPIRSTFSEQSVMQGIMPRENGKWGGEAGESSWKPDKWHIPKKENPTGKTWDEIGKRHKIDGIPFKNGYPDFGRVSQADVKIDAFGINRADNFNQADKKLAEQWTTTKQNGKEWKASDVNSYRKENNLTWHEKEDMKTLQLLPREIHANIPHVGGVAAKKNELAQA